MVAIGINMKLEECPLCGSPDIRVQLLEDDSHYIRCCDVTLIRPTREEVIKDWNGFYCRQLLKTRQDRLQQVLNEYIKKRLEISGSFGNLQSDRRLEVMIHEISAELKWDIREALK